MRIPSVPNPASLIPASLSPVALAVLVPLSVSTVGCDGGGYTYGGEPFSEYLPLDQDRYWEYRQCAATDTGDAVEFDVYAFYDRAGCDSPDDGVLRVEKFPETQNLGNGTEVVTLDYYYEDSAGSSSLTHSIKWSSDDSSGIKIHGWTDHNSGESVDYGKPIQVADYQMNRGDSTSTTTDGATFTGTFVEVRNDCPNNWGPNWEECFLLTLEADGADVPFDGSYWLGATYGPAAFMGDGATDVWVLDEACAAPSC